MLDKFYRAWVAQLARTLPMLMWQIKCPVMAPIYGWDRTSTFISLPTALLLRRLTLNLIQLFMKIINLILFLFAGVFAFGQEVLVPLTGNAELVRQSKIWKANKSTVKSGDLLPLPFVDDFSVDRFPGNAGGYAVLWENRSATRNTGWGKNPPTIGVVSLDGADEVGYPYSWGTSHGPADTLMSLPINLVAGPDDGIGISFYYQPRGNNYFLNNPNDSLMLEFYAPDLDEWFLAWSTADTSDPDNFTFVYIPIGQARYLKEGFRFRFTNIAPLNGAVGTWNLDYIWLDQNSTNANDYNNDVAFVDQANTLLQTYTAMPRDHYATDPVGFMRDKIDVLLRNLNNGPRTLEGNEIRVLFEGNEVGIYPNSNEPGIGAGATLIYEHNVAASPNNIVFDPSLSPDELEFEVQFIHGVSDFSPTASNDTMRFKQNFYTHYAYDDGQAEYGYAIAKNGASVAMRYLNHKSDSVFALNIYTIPIDYDIENTVFNIKIWRSEEHTSELQSRPHLVCRLLLEKKKNHKCGTKLSLAAQSRQRGHRRLCPSAAGACRDPPQQRCHARAGARRDRC